MKRLLLILLCVSATLRLEASPRTWFVRPGASGTQTGNDWTNAKTNIPYSSLGTGDTIYGGGGQYGAFAPTGNGLLGASIQFIRARATNSACSSVAGWDNSIDSQPVFSQGSFVNFGSYWTIDGVVPYTGILFTNSTLGLNDFNNVNVQNRSGFILRNADVGCVVTTNTDVLGTIRCLYFVGTTSNTFENLYLHNATTIILDARNNGPILRHIIIDNNRNRNTAFDHPNIWDAQGGTTNLLADSFDVSDISVECLMMTGNGGPGSQAPNSHWLLLNWLIHNPHPGDTVARIFEPQYAAGGSGNEYIVWINCTFVDMPGFGFRLEPSSAPDQIGNVYRCATYGCIWINCANAHGFVSNTGKAIECTNAFNISSGTAPAGASSLGGATTAIFVDYANRNYNIVTNIGSSFPRNKGVNLTVNALDYFSNPRGNDGTFDMGYAEAADLAPPPPPVELRCCSQP